MISLFALFYLIVTEIFHFCNVSIVTCMSDVVQLYL